MRFFRTASTHLTVLGRLTAWSGVLLVVLLAWLSFDPAAHAWLHGHHAGHEPSGAAQSGRDHDSDSSSSEGHSCAITKFAHGHVELLVELGVVAATIAHIEAISFPSVPGLARVDLVLPPGCGPPVG